MEEAAHRSDGGPSASPAEIAGVLSLATDMAMGNAYEHGLRRALLAVGLAEAAGADPETVEDAYLVSLLMYVGCTAETSVFTSLFGNDLAGRAAVAPAVWGRGRGDARRRSVWAPARAARRMAGAPARSQVAGRAGVSGGAR